jgi:pimeloyl-ACP methyl ester carboxylesterase
MKHRQIVFALLSLLLTGCLKNEKESNTDHSAPSLPEKEAASRTTKKKNNQAINPKVLESPAPRQNNKNEKNDTNKQRIAEILRDERYSNIKTSFISRWNTYFEKIHVPLDYKYKNRNMIELAYGVRLANHNPESKQTLWINYGGPGTGTIDTFISKLNEGSYSEALLDDYNIVLLDPRGTGYSAFRHLGYIEPSIAHHMGTNTLTKDIEFLRKHLREFAIPTPEGDVRLNQLDTINLLGHSYGTTAFMNYTHFHPEHVRSLILDSVADVITSKSADHIRVLNDAFKKKSRWKNKQSLRYTSGGDNNNTSIATFDMVSCTDNGFVDEYRYRSETIRFKNVELCQDVQSNSIEHLAFSSRLANFHPPVLILSSLYDIPTPHVFAEQTQKHLFNQNSLMLTVESDKHCLAFQHHWISTVDRYILNYLKAPQELTVQPQEIKFSEQQYLQRSQDKPAQ